MRGLETYIRGLETNMRGPETYMRGPETYMRGLETAPIGAKQLCVDVLHTPIHCTTGGHLGFLTPVHTVGHDQASIVSPCTQAERVGNGVTCRNKQRQVCCEVFGLTLIGFL